MRQTLATGASGGRDACSPARGCSWTVPLRCGQGQQRQPCPGPRRQPGPHRPRPPPPASLSLPPKGTSSPVTAGGGAQAHSIHSPPGAQELRSEAWAERVLAGKLLPTPSRAQCPRRPGLGVGPPRGVRPAHPPSHPPAHGGLPCTPVSMRGLQGGQSRPQPGPSLGWRSSTDGPDGQSQTSTGTLPVPTHPNRQTLEILETDAAPAAEPADHACVHCAGPPDQGPHPRRTTGPSHTCVLLRSTGGDTRGRGPPVGRGRQAQEGSRLGLLGWPLLCEARQ